MLNRFQTHLLSGRYLNFIDACRHYSIHLHQMQGVFSCYHLYFRSLSISVCRQITAYHVFSNNTPRYIWQNTKTEFDMRSKNGHNTTFSIRYLHLHWWHRKKIKIKIKWNKKCCLSNYASNILQYNVYKVNFLWKSKSMCTNLGRNKLVKEKTKKVLGCCSYGQLSTM